MERRFWILLSIWVLIVSFLFSLTWPLGGDEELYALAIKDVQKYGVMPYATYFGSPMFWKPPLMFAVYGILTAPFTEIIPDYILFRMPSFIFTCLSALLFYLLIKGDVKEEKRGFALFIFVITMPIFGFGSRILTDIMAFFFVILMLYCTKMLMDSDGKSNALAIVIGISLIGMGLSKSPVIAFFGFLLALGYFSLREKKNAEAFVRICVAGVVALAILWIFPILTIPSNAGYAYFSYVADTSRVVIPQLVKYTSITYILNSILQATPLLLIAGIIALYTLLKTRKPEFYNVWCVSSLMLVVFAFVLPWYFIFFVPAIAIVIARTEWDSNIKKALLAIIIFITITISIAYSNMLNVSEDSVEISKFIEKLGENKTLLITVASSGGSTYTVSKLPYFCIVTPRTTMHIYNESTEQFEYVGINDKIFNNRENIRGIVFDYNNESYVPKFLYQQNDTFWLYIPPVARTVKNFEGDFDIIIAYSEYYDAAKEALPEYEEIYRTKNGEYGVLRKK